MTDKLGGLMRDARYGRRDALAEVVEHQPSQHIDLDAGATSNPPVPAPRLGDWVRDVLLGDDDYDRTRRRTLRG
jgi:hypothetical protein